MLYKKNSAPSLDDGLFENPTSEYRAAPFWAWNGKLEKETLERQIVHMKEMGFGGFHMHTRSGLVTEYLGDEYMEMVRTCCDKAESEEMLAWLYDEDRWSSGPAGGLVTRDRKEFRRKRLMVFPEDKGWNTPKAEALVSGEPYLLSCYDVTLDTDGFLTGYKRIGVSDAASGDKWYAYVVNEKESSWFNGGTYVDAMDKEAMREFLNVTHERYYSVIGDRFDKSVPAIFTDEPNANHESAMTIPTPQYKGRILYTWSRFFEEKYIERYGSDLLDSLPELFWIKRDRGDSIIKYRFFDLVAHLFSQNFSAQLGNWCKEHGIALTGHLLHEPELYNQSICSGEHMRNYGFFGLPGIDMLCNAVELTTAKQTQSCVHQYGKEGMMSELYGVTNWDFDFRGHKFQGDWQAALGVSVRVPHLAWYSMAGEAKRDYPAAIGYQSPWFKEYPAIENHFARVNTAMTRGTPIVKIGVIHPVESYWVAAGPNSQLSTLAASLENNFVNVTGWLLESHLDFDYVCESLIPSLSGDDPRAVGKMRYDAIVLPGCLSIRSTTIEFLEKFAAAGGRVIFSGGRPSFVDGVVSDAAEALFGKSVKVSMDKASLTDALSDFRTVSMLRADGHGADDLIYSMRRDNDCDWLFIAHSKEPVDTYHTYGIDYDVLKPVDTVFTVKGEYTPVEYDTMTGEIKPIPFTLENGNTVIRRRVNALDSLLLKLCPVKERSFTLPDAGHVTLSTFDIKDTVGFELSEPNVLLLDLAEYAFDGGEFNPREDVLRVAVEFRDKLGYPQVNGKLAQPYTIPDEPATHSIQLRYAFDSELEITGAHLALEDAEKVEITFNGERIPSAVDGWFTDECIKTVPLPAIKTGKNVIVLSIPFGKRTNIEWIYVLGAFGVRLNGCNASLTALPEKIGFGDITPQGLPFYGANVTYKIPVSMPEKGALRIRAPHYRGSLIGVSCDGKRVGSVILPPYTAQIPDLDAGEHIIELTLFGNRHNSFGALHSVGEAKRWFGPAAWRTKGDDWCYEYKLKRLGILKSPVFEIIK